MTVAVSTSSAVEQITSAFPVLFDERVLIGVGAIGLITVGNLRGLREAGNIFAIPTYLFIGSALLMIAVGAFRIVVLGEGDDLRPDARSTRSSGTLQPLTLILLLRAFAAGAVALTGTEAIATGVPAFKPPEAKNAATTLAVHGRPAGRRCSSGSRSWPSTSRSCRSSSRRSRPSSRRSRGRSTATASLFYLFQAFTALLLFLAANTSFNAFPRLLAILAGDGHMPRQFALRGDRLAFSYGIIVLASLAAALIVIFRGDRPTCSSRSTRSACSSTSRSARPA